MPRRELIDRWRTRDGVASAREILRRLADGSSLRGLGLPTVDGLLDLRGIRAGGLAAHGVEIAGVDLSYSSLSEARLDGVRWSRCRFDGADLSAAVFIGGSIAESTMRRTDLRETLVADADWESVDLVGIKSNHFAAERTTFTRSTFPALVKVDFTGCSFDDCRFTGGLSEVRFLGRGQDSESVPAVLRNVTFSSDDFRYAEFDGMDFENVLFPESDSLIVVPQRFRAVAERASTISSSRGDDLGKAFRRFLSRESLRPGLSETAGWVVGRRDLTDDHPNGQELAESAARTLNEAQEQLRTEGVVP
ncbi:pentapeptide repeat-containing protein [Micromonospora sp. NPDC093277]|uniref:pentapeptide repeat-containing protein n=1 Tax=Micromonospora sp. NPDC093277 TaxID=3364291 RepID=UPI00382FCB3C